jgi:hypothetical protein
MTLSQLVMVFLLSSRSAGILSVSASFWDVNAHILVKRKIVPAQNANNQYLQRLQNYCNRPSQPLKDR